MNTAKRKAAIELLKNAATVLVVATTLLAVPALIPRPASTVARLIIVVVVMCSFIYLGFRVVATRGGLGMALILFVGGLAVELGTFACLYLQEGVLCAVTTQAGLNAVEPHLMHLAYKSQADLVSCFLLSVDVWTAGGYGSLMAKESQGWLMAAEQLLGYTYMGVFIAILITVLHQSVKTGAPE